MMYALLIMISMMTRSVIMSVRGVERSDVDDESGNEDYSDD